MKHSLKSSLEKNPINQQLCFRGDLVDQKGLLFGFTLHYLRRCWEEAGGEIDHPGEQKSGGFSKIIYRQSN